VDSRGILVILASRVALALRDFRDLKVSQEQLELLEHQVLRDQLEPRVLLDQLGSQDHKDLTGKLEQLERLGHRVILGKLGRRDKQE